MEGLKELLAKHKEKELTEADFDSELKKILPKDWIPKTTFNELNEKYKSLEKQKSELEKTVEEATKKQTSVDDLTKQIAELKTKHDAELKAKEVEFEAYRKDSYIDGLLTKSGVKTVKAVRGLLDIEKIVKGNDGNYLGLKEQIEALKKDENTSYLFANAPQDEGNKPIFGSSSGGSGSHNDNDLTAIRKAMGV